MSYEIINTTAATELNPDGVNLANGTAANPSLAFTNDPNQDTGIFLNSADVIAITTAGTSRLFVDTSTIESTLPIHAPDGTVSAPSYSFATDSGAGLFRNAANNIVLATNGASRVSITNESCTFSDPVWMDDEVNFTDASVPTISDATYGALYKKSEDDGLYWNTQGSGEVDLTGASYPLTAPDGSAATPSFSFASDTGTGMFYDNNEFLIYFAVGGTARTGVKETLLLPDIAAASVTNPPAGYRALFFDSSNLNALTSKNSAGTTTTY